MRRQMFASGGVLDQSPTYWYPGGKIKTFLFLVELGFELKALCLQIRHCTT
jgi:hypothetical protein